MQTTQTNDVEDVTMSDILNLASWERERKPEELNSFVEKRLEAVGGDLDV